MMRKLLLPLAIAGALISVNAMADDDATGGVADQINAKSQAALDKANAKEDKVSEKADKKLNRFKGYSNSIDSATGLNTGKYVDKAQEKKDQANDKVHEKQQNANDKVQGKLNSYGLGGGN